MRGLFITLEGGDGCGKTTLVEGLKEVFQGREDVIFTREPGGTPIGEEIRQMILDKGNDAMTSRTEALLYAASRAQHVEEKIEPALEKGYTVICERFVLSSLAYQGYGRQQNLEDIRRINEFAVGKTSPDAVIFMDVDWKETLARKSPKERDRLEEAGESFHRRVFYGYRELKKGKGIHVIDGTGSPEEVLSACLSILEKKGLRR